MWDCEAVGPLLETPLRESSFNRCHQQRGPLPRKSWADERSVSLHDLFVLSIDWNCFKLRDQIVPSTWTLKEAIGLIRFPLLPWTVMQTGCDRIT